MTTLKPLTDAHRERAFHALTQGDALQWTPMDFIRDEDFRRIHRAEIAEAWTRPLPPEDDFSVTSADGNTLLFAERLRWDSDFFGYPIVRLNGTWNADPTDRAALSALIGAWRDHLRERGIRYALCVVPPEELALLNALTANRWMLLETRLSYHRTLADFVPEARYPVRRATSADVAILGATARECVNPFDRFHADPFISATDADRMMTEWVRASIETPFADFVLVPDVEQPRAFATVKTHQGDWSRWGINLAQSVVLGAVHPMFKGWYTKLISESHLVLAEHGATHVFWKTQITNRAAIRTAERLGYRFGRGELVFRVIL